MNQHQIRINKFLSMCGVASRRGAETLISSGRVTLNGSPIEKLGTLVDPATDVVALDGKPLSPVEHKVYVVFNKPPKVMTTLDDPFNRRTVVHYLKDLPVRVYPVGRLDMDTEGVLLLTNDGELAYRLAHPRYQVRKIYDVKVEGLFQPEAAAKIAAGLQLEDNSVGRAEVQIISQAEGQSRLRMTLREGRKREVKQLCRAVGHPVRFLRRIEFAGITARGLKLGKWRYLTPDEIDRLRQVVADKKPAQG